MAESLEGWGIRYRFGWVAAAVIPLMALVGLLLSGWWYNRSERPLISKHVTTFPAPGVETRTNEPGRGRHMPQTRPTPDPAIARVKAQAARDGIAGWSAPQ